MKKIKYNMFGSIEQPTIILSTKWHKHLGTIENITDSINSAFNMNTCDEISFDVEKEIDGVVCGLWDEIVDLKYIYVPQHREYYEITISMDDADSTVKHISAKSASECELSQKLLRDFHCNDETDILHPNYVITKFYNPNNPKGSLLNRVLADKGGEWKIAHVDDTIANIQRTFNCDGTSIYDFLVNTVATEIGCIFVFDSVYRTISAYDLRSTCRACDYRGEFLDYCPKCGSKNIYRGYGKFQNVFISPENYAQSITVEGDAGSVKNCFKVVGGDDLITATVDNLNPSGSSYIYRFSDAMYHDMPTELVEKLQDYFKDYNAVLEEYEGYTKDYYDAVDEILRLQTTMMPDSEIPEDTTAEKELRKIMDGRFSVAMNREKVSATTVDNAVKSYARVLIDPRYKVDIFETTYTEENHTWSGKFTVTSNGKVDDDGNPEEASSVVSKDINISFDNYEAFLKQKIEKCLDRTKYGLTTIFNLENDIDFKNALTKYSLDRLASFESSYRGVLEVLQEQGISEDKTDKLRDYDELFGTDLYKDMYLPYYKRMEMIQDEMVVREKEIEVPTSQRDEATKKMREIQNRLNMQNYLGDDLYNIFVLYLREDTYTNSNYISTGLDNVHVINMAKELLQVANEKLYQASELQFTLNGSLVNFLSTKDFAEFKDNFEIGDWIICQADGVNYRLRVINVNVNHSDLNTITITFSNVAVVNNYMSDTKSVLDQAKSMATSFQYYANQAEEGNKAQESVKDFMDNGLDSAIFNILAGNNQDIVVDEHGLTARQYDDTINDYGNEQLKLTNNILVFTTDNWATASLGLGKHYYTKYDEDLGDFVTEQDYGLSSTFVQAGYIYGTQIIAGDLYSTNYSPTTGTHINLNDGTFSFAGGSLSYDGDTLNIKGTVTANDGTIGGWNIGANNISTQYVYTDGHIRDVYTTMLQRPVGTGSPVLQVVAEHMDGSADYPFRIMADGTVYADNLYLNESRIYNAPGELISNSYYINEETYEMTPPISSIIECTVFNIEPHDSESDTSAVRTSLMDCNGIISKSIESTKLFSTNIIADKIGSSFIFGNIHNKKLVLSNVTTDELGRIPTDLYMNKTHNFHYITGIQGSLSGVLYDVVFTGTGREWIRIVDPSTNMPKANASVESLTIYYLSFYTNE